MTPRAKVQDGSAEGNPQGPASQQEGSPCFQFLATGAVGVPKGTCPTHVHSTEQFPNLAGKEVLRKPREPTWGTDPGNRPGEPTLGRTEGAGAAEACWTAHGEALCSRLWKVLDEQPLPLPLPHRNCPFVATTLWKEDTTTDKKQSEPAGGRGGSGIAGRQPACPEATRGIKLSPWVASSTVEPGTSPAAENTTVKPIIQRIKSES